MLTLRALRQYRLVVCVCVCVCSKCMQLACATHHHALTMCELRLSVCLALCLNVGQRRDWDETHETETGYLRMHQRDYNDSVRTEHTSNQPTDTHTHTKKRFSHPKCTPRSRFLCIAPPPLHCAYSNRSPMSSMVIENWCKLIWAHLQIVCQSTIVENKRIHFHTITTTIATLWEYARQYGSTSISINMSSCCIFA